MKQKELIDNIDLILEATHDDLLISDNINAVSGVDHPANLGLPLAARLQREYGGRVFMVDSPKTDEFCDLARVTGVPGIYRTSSTHALNIKGTVRMHCRRNNVRYEDGNYIVCHIDGGMTVSAHDHGRMIDATNNAAGEGPFTPTRTGALPVSAVIDYFFDNEHKSRIGIEDADFGSFEVSLSAAREVLTRNAVFTGLKEGWIPHIRIGRKYLINFDKLVEILEAC